MTTPQHLSDRYELGEILGFGGMSEVHLARDLRLHRDVAIKVLRADLARDPSFYLRFRREAQNAAALNHPAIVAVYDTGEAETPTGPLPYIVMEYVEGVTLRDIVHTEELWYDPRLRFTFLNPLRIGDFIYGTSGQSATAILTATHVASGETAWRARGFSRANMLYARPGADDTEIWHALEAAQVAALVRRLPEGLDGVLLRALSKAPHERYESMECFRQALEPFAAAPGASSSVLDLKK